MERCEWVGARLGCATQTKGRSVTERESAGAGAPGVQVGAGGAARRGLPFGRASAAAAGGAELCANRRASARDAQDIPRAPPNGAARRDGWLRAGPRPAAPRCMAAMHDAPRRRAIAPYLYSISAAQIARFHPPRDTCSCFVEHHPCVLH